MNRRMTTNTSYTQSKSVVYENGRVVQANAYEEQEKTVPSGQTYKQMRIARLNPQGQLETETKQYVNGRLVTDKHRRKLLTSR